MQAADLGRPVLGADRRPAEVDLGHRVDRARDVRHVRGGRATLLAALEVVDLDAAAVGRDQRAFAGRRAASPPRAPSVRRGGARADQARARARAAGGRGRRRPPPPGRPVRRARARTGSTRRPRRAPRVPPRRAARGRSGDRIVSGPAVPIECACVVVMSTSSACRRSSSTRSVPCDRADSARSALRDVGESRAEQRLEVGAADLQHRRRRRRRHNRRPAARTPPGRRRRAGRSPARRAAPRRPGSRSSPARPAGAPGLRGARRARSARARAVDARVAGHEHEGRGAVDDEEQRLDDLARALTPRSSAARSAVVDGSGSGSISCAHALLLEVVVHVAAGAHRPLLLRVAGAPRARRRAVGPGRACRSLLATVPWPDETQQPLTRRRPPAEHGGDLRRVVADLLLVVGGILLAYPLWSGLVTTVQQGRLDDAYGRETAQFSVAVRSSPRTRPQARAAAGGRGAPPRQALRRDARARRPGGAARDPAARPRPRRAAGRQPDAAGSTPTATASCCATGPSTTGSRRCPAQASRSPSPAIARRTGRPSRASTRCARATASIVETPYARFVYEVAKTTTVEPGRRRRPLRPRLRARAHDLHAALQRQPPADRVGAAGLVRAARALRSDDAAARRRASAPAQGYGGRSSLDPSRSSTMNAAPASEPG